MNESERRETVEQVLANLSGLRALRIHHLCRQTLHRDVSLAQLHLMALLDGEGPMTVSELAHVLSASLPSASSILDRMEDRGYVRRSREAADRRVVTVEITDKGREAVHEFSGPKREEMMRITGSMTDEELVNFVQGMDAFLSAIHRLHQVENPDAASEQVAS